MRIVKSLFRRGVRQLNKWRLISPELTSRLLYFNVFGRFPDIDNPKDLNEKILAQAFRGDTSGWSELADKYAVRAYVEEKGLGDILVPMYGVWDTVEDIDFDSLPDSFVLKTTDGTARNIIVKDKSSLNPEAVRKQLRRWMDEKRINDEPHYQGIKRRIIAEHLLATDDGLAPTDYKIYCIGGRAEYCLACVNRDMRTFRGNFALFKLPEWRNINGIAENWKTDKMVRRPVHLEAMIDYAVRLAGDFPLVRVDFYEEEGKVFFGEMTFTSFAGRAEVFTQSMLCEIGDKVQLR